VIHLRQVLKEGKDLVQVQTTLEGQIILVNQIKNLRVEITKILINTWMFHNKLVNSNLFHRIIWEVPCYHPKIGLQLTLALMESITIIKISMLSSPKWWCSHLKCRWWINKLQWCMVINPKVSLWLLKCKLISTLKCKCMFNNLNSKWWCNKL